MSSPPPGKSSKKASGATHKNHPHKRGVIKIDTQGLSWVKLSFDGEYLYVRSSKTGKLMKKLSATSGLPPNAPKLHVLIKEGRTDLSLTTDYRKPEYQNVADAGPIPAGAYELKLTSDMAYEKSGGGWGEGAWRLQQSLWRVAEYKLGIGRAGFFLHQDGPPPGTAGCIGVKSAAAIRELRDIFKKAHKNGQGEVELNVVYESK